jgi:hypothetical protein
MPSRALRRAPRWDINLNSLANAHCAASPSDYGTSDGSGHRPYQALCADPWPVARMPIGISSGHSRTGQHCHKGRGMAMRPAIGAVDIGGAGALHVTQDLEATRHRNAHSHALANSNLFRFCPHVHRLDAARMLALGSPFNVSADGRVQRLAKESPT